MSASSRIRKPLEKGDGRARPVLVVVFTTILIDFIGFSVLFPVLPLYADRLGGTPTEIGMIMMIFAAAQLLFLPTWGFVSDRVGRRPVLLTALAGTAASFVLLSRAKSVAAILVARALAGFFAASISTAQAVVTDVTSESERASGMGMIGAAIGLGMMVGPLLGSALIRFGVSAPFIAVACLAAFNFALAWLRLPESHPAAHAPADWRGLRAALVPTPLRLAARVHDVRIGLYLYLYFHVYAAFAVLEAMITLYAGKRFGVGIAQMGWFFAWTALWLAWTQGMLLRRLVRRFSESTLVEIGLLLMAAGLFAVVVSPSYAWLFAVAPLLALGNGVALPSFASLYSQACRAERLGHLLGQGQSMATTGRIAGPVVGGVAMQYVGMGVPFALAGALMLAALVLFRGRRATLLGAA